MKLENLVESDPRVGGTPQKEEMLNTFIDQVRGMDVRSLQSLAKKLTEIAMNYWRNVGAEDDPVGDIDQITDARVLVSLIGDLVNEL